MACEGSQIYHLSLSVLFKEAVSCWDS